VAVLEDHAADADAWHVERAQSLLFAGDSFQQLGEPARAADAYRRAIALDQTRREPRLRLASLCCRLGRFEEAVEQAERTLAIAGGSPYPELEANYTWLPHGLLYWSLFWLGRRAEAREHWHTCRRMRPEDALIRSHGRLFGRTKDEG
jgi:tetratricopeptide (TPR) repeat protein